ncbi:hydroxylase [Leucobacter sp. 7(1)]|uniref:NmrA family NAD(P)-binding protein n=1 Tax=Leucobacter sp. 7(1) TaxID=1255613 RepID=UPI00097F1297|nr:NmrA family NAD(P)-binding protein [Leucobacter sp. 7(1)]SJN09959.1 hydroxylase [Leucobacter sp. 7(1)]
MTFIIHGATGAQGSPVLSALRAAGHDVTAAVRNITALPDDVTGASVDLTDAAALTTLYTGAAGVFVHLPLTDPAQAQLQAVAIAAAISAARPARVVISTSGTVVSEPDSPMQAPADSPLATLIRKVTDSGVSTAVVEPRLYLENLLLPVIQGPARSEGVLRYPLPADYPVSWSSHTDVAAVAAHLLTDTTVTGTVSVGHLPGLTGADLATELGSAWGQDVRFEGITPDQFGELITPLFGPGAGPVVGLYRALNTQDRFVVSAARSAQQLFGLQPRPVSEWAADVAQ